MTNLFSIMVPKPFNKGKLVSSRNGAVTPVHHKEKKNVDSYFTPYIKIKMDKRPKYKN